MSLADYIGESGVTFADIGGPSDPTLVDGGVVALTVDAAERFATWLASQEAPSEDYTMRVTIKRTALDDATNADVTVLVAMRYGGGDWLLMYVQVADSLGWPNARVVLKTASAIVLTVDDVLFADGDEHEFKVVLTGNLATLYMDDVALRTDVDITGCTGGLQTYIIWSGHAPASFASTPVLALSELVCEP